MIVSVDDHDVWKIRSETTFKTHEIRFKIGQEFDESTPDGRKVRVRVLHCMVCMAGVKAGYVHLCRVKGNTV